MKLKKVEVDAALRELSSWRKVEGRDAIQRRFTFADFNEAFGFMSRVALLADKIDHHPEWSNIYKVVDVVLSTHEAHGVTELDVKMAKFMDAIGGSHKTPALRWS